jgi:Ca2+-binding EF-hand superfamily protein
MWDAVRMIQDIDKEGNGMVGLEDFMDMMRDK